MVRRFCPTCHTTFESKTSDGPPFCSPRCQQVDLGRWLDERYALPSQSEDGADGEADLDWESLEP